MKKTILILMAVTLIVLSGCSEVDVNKMSDKDLQRISEAAVVCNAPYIRVGTGCCVDQNRNGICDNDEGITPTTAPSANAGMQPIQSEASIGTQSQGVTEMMDCSAGAAIGFKACSLLANGDVEVTIFHSASSVFTPLTLTGAQYYLYDENGQKLAEASQMGQVQPGQEVKYVLPISGTSGTTKVEVRPVINDGGVDKICVNQRVIVIPANSCR